IRRVLHALATILVAVALVFLAMRVIPGDPLLATFGQHADAEQMAQLRREYGWDQPLAVQLGQFLWRLVTTGDLGRSLARTNVSVSRELAQRIPATIELTAAALVLAIPLGIAAGTAAAVWRNRWPDRLVTTTALVGVSIPVFFLAVCLREVFTFLPTSSRLPPAVLAGFKPTTEFYLVETLMRGKFDLLALALEHLLLPAFVLSTIPMAMLAR